MRIYVSLAVFMTIALLLALTFAGSAGPLFGEGHEPRGESEESTPDEDDSIDVSSLTPYGRVGVISFEDFSKKSAGKAKFLSILLGRLKNARPETEFIEITVELDEDTPLMGKVSRELGEEYGIDAILTGAFVVNIVGGVYPSRTNNTPVGKIGIDCRIIDTESGWSRGKAVMTWEKNKIYPSGVRTQKSLEGKLMRDGVDDLIEVLLRKGYLSFEPELVIEASDEGNSEDTEGEGAGDSESGDQEE